MKEEGNEDKEDENEEKEDKEEAKDDKETACKYLRNRKAIGSLSLSNEVPQLRQKNRSVNCSPSQMQ